MGIKFVSISTPALKYLSFKGYNIDLDSGLINIYAPSLLSLKYADFVAKDYVLHNFSSLVDAKIDFKSFKWETWEEIGYSANKLLGGLSNVKLLKMSGNTFKVLSLADDLITTLPTFYNLIHLEVTSKLPVSTDRTLSDFLQISPNLESLVFFSGL